METVKNLNDIIYQKFAISRIHYLLSVIVWISILFFFTELGSSTWNFVVELVLKEIRIFELTLWNIFTKTFGAIGLIITLFFIVFFTYSLCAFLLPILYLILISISLLILKSLNLVPSVLEKLLVYEQNKYSKLRRLYQLNDTKNFFSPNITNKIDKLDDYYLQYLFKNNTIEYMEAYSLTQLDIFNFKLANNYSKLNFFLVYFGTSTFSFSFKNGCEHGYAEEIYCGNCYEKEKNEGGVIKQFIKKYKSEAAKEKVNKKPKRKIISNESDLNLLNLEEPFTLNELKQKRNIALRENHPDLVSNMSKEVQEFAKNQTQKIIQAYERLEKLAD